MNCTFCHKSFTRKSNLDNHLKTAKYCLKKREQDALTCSGCKNIFSSKQKLEVHQYSCHDFSKHQETIRQEITTERLTEENKQLKLKVQELEDRIYNIALKGAQRPTTTFKQINNTYYQAILKPVDFKSFAESAENLTLEHVLKGPAGYAEFALEYPLRNGVVCTDYSRRKVKYKDSKGSIKVDPEMTTLSTEFFRSINSKSKELINEHGMKLVEKIDDTQVGDKAEKLTELLTSVSKGSKGEKSEFHHEFVKEICNRTVKEEDDPLSPSDEAKDFDNALSVDT